MYEGELIMLIKCKECNLQISSNAVFCPHCGDPKKANQYKTVNTNKRKRLPNGFGQITKINSNLRNPYRAMITVGKNENGKPVCKLLKPQSYFKTYNEAYNALIEYNKNPYDLETDITVEELYASWTQKYFKTLKSKSSERTITSAWRYCSSVYSMKVKTLRNRHIKYCIDNGTAIIRGTEKKPSAGMKSRIKSMFNLMLDYALEYEIVDKNYARTFNVSDEVLEECEEQKRSHIPFSDDEINLLWNSLDKIKYVDIILMQCYSGWRPQELGLIELKNVDLKEWLFVGGIKTKAGTNRTVPIHTKIRPIVTNLYNIAKANNSKYLIYCDDSVTHKSSSMLTYDKYRQRFKKVIEMLNINPDHRAHDGRVHFVTMAKKFKVDEYAIKYMVGHSIVDITEKVYTKRNTEWLKQEIEKIK